MKANTFGSTTPKLVVESVIPLSDTELKQIAQNLGLEPSLLTLVNQKTASLIGGMRISYQGQVLDLSLENKLNRIRE